MSKLLVAVAVSGLLGSVTAQVTERVSVDSSGGQANGGADLPFPAGSSVSADGRYVAFVSGSTNLVPGDTNGNWDVFVHDRTTRSTTRVSVDSGGNQGYANSGLFGISISADGRFVAFESAAANLVPGDTNGARDILVRDCANGTTERVSVDSLGTQGNANSFHPAISGDGRYVAFYSLASNLVVGDANGLQDVFVRDRVNGTTELISLTSAGVQGNGASEFPSISADGRYVAFDSAASNLVAGDMNGHQDIFLRDRLNGTTEIVSLATNQSLGNGDSSLSSLSNDGRFVAFTSAATNLAPGDANNGTDVFVRDRVSGTTTLTSVSMSGVPGNRTSQEISLTADGHFAAFKSSATDLIPNSPTDPQGAWVFVRDLQAGITTLVSRATDGSIPASGGSQMPWISADGRFVAFESNMTSLVPGDTNGNVDVFLNDRASSGFESICDPGANNVIACPCGNPPSGRGRGCDNSSSTGGATLGASGIAYLSMDTLAFATGDERPNATSVLLQGDALDPNGVVFGQGVRCASGGMKRMYVKTAVNGSITAPDLSAGDPTVSARSAQLGVPIQPGQPYYFLVYYRDPIVLGGCSAASTFNATETGSVTYWP
jgi:Tol biopolymer transport system component